MKVRLLPYKKFEIRTLLPHEEVIRRLEENTEKRNIFALKWNVKAFEGEIGKKSFTINRILFWYQSFGNPIIHGELSDEGDGCRIAVSMRSNFFVITFLCFLLVGLLVNFFSFLNSFIATTEHTTSNESMTLFIRLFLTLGLYAIVWIFIVGCFWYEVKKSKETLIRILKEDVKE